MKVTIEAACVAQDVLVTRGHRVALQDVHEALDAALKDVPEPDYEREVLNALEGAYDALEAKLAEVREFAKDIEHTNYSHRLMLILDD